MLQKAFSKIWILVVIAVIAAGGVLAWWYWSVFKKVSPPAVGEQEEEMVEVKLAIDYESFDLVNKSFKGKILGPEEKNIKVIVDDSTKFYRTSDGQKEYYTFSEFYTLLNPKEMGVPWPLMVRGIFEKENQIKAKEVFIIAQ